MRSRPGVALALVVFVALAGCNAFGPAGGPTPTGGDAPADAATSVDGRETADERATTGTGGGFDALRFAQRHLAALRNTSFTIATSRTVWYRNGTVAEHVRTRVAVAATDPRYTVAVSRDGRGLSDGAWTAMGLWANRSVELRVLRWANGTATHHAGEPYGNLAALTYWRQINVLFDAAPLAVAGRHTENGTATYTIVSTGQPTDSLPWAVPAHVSSFTLTALAQGDGLVRSFTVRYETVHDGRPVTVVHTFEVTRVGNTTVERPDWVGTALNETTA